MRLPRLKSWWGAGIGGGKDADGATVVISGGIVEAWAGADVDACRWCGFSQSQ